ncbi:BQ2448_6180 [Microbotryum intermedium]|uniref:BQ2448_6180 protein n=1 Tax=Microbotryum intermedium TaxID=269621 RepID=A0A238FIY8_9BASI|nr:BQ2448_6180 [Microbotryum intermedium]
MASIAPNASLLRFALVPPLSTSTSPTACLVARLELRQRSAIVEPEPDRSRGPADSASAADMASTSAIQVEDLRFGNERASVEVYRILDPGNKEPFVSLSRIFLACQISPLEGLLRFKLVRPTDYDSSLGGIAPFRDIWVPLKLAASISDELNAADELSALLEWSTRKAFTVEDKEEGGIVHNTSTMLSTRFARVHLLPSGNQVRTLMPSSLPAKAAPGLPPSSFDDLWSYGVTWSIELYEEYLELCDAADDGLPLRAPSSAPSRAKEVADGGPPDLTPSFVFTSLLTLLSLTDELPTETRKGRHHKLIRQSYELPNGFKLGKSDILGVRGLSSVSSDMRSKLALVDAISRLIAREWRLDSSKQAAGRCNPASGVPGDALDGNDGGEEERGWAEMRQKLNRIEGELAVLSSRTTSTAPPLHRGEDHILALRDKVDGLSSQISQFEHRLQALTRLTSYSSSASLSPASESMPVLEGEEQDANRTNKLQFNVRQCVRAIEHRSVVPWLVVGAAGVWAAHSYLA